MAPQIVANATAITPMSPTNEHPETSAHKSRIQSIIEGLGIDSIQAMINALNRTPYTQQQIETDIELVTADERELPICHMKNDNRPYIRVKVNDVQCHPLLDCGAMVGVYSYEKEEELNKFHTTIEPCNITITTVNQPNHEVKGLMWLLYEMGGCSVVIPTIVMKSHKSYFIVGMDFWQAFDIKLQWGNSRKAVSPCNPEMSSQLQVTEKREEVDVGMIQAAVNRTGGIGMVSAASRSSSTVLNKIVHSVPKYRGSDHTRLLQRKLTSPIHPVTTNYEYGTIEMAPKPAISRHENLSTPDATSKVDTFQCDATATTSDLIRQMLKAMPRNYNNKEIHEIAIQQPEIRTATGADDSYQDVKREKHTCVTEPHKLTEEQQAELNEVMAEFPYTPETGPLNVTPIYKQTINTGNAAPEIRRQYPMSPYIQTEVEKEIQNLIERDIIEEIDFSPWRWPVLWVRKKSGGGRICLDARGLNKVTIRDAYPTLRVDTILQNLPQAKFISALDMTQAFHQLEIVEADRNKTAFSVGHRLYRYKRATMGFTNSPADLAKVLDKVFGDLMPHVYHYVDDFVIVSATFAEHLILLREVAKRLRKAKLTISKKKSLFCHKKITFLGYVLTDAGLEPNPERLAPIMNYKRPSNVKELRRLVGLIGWYRRFIPYAAEILAPLSDLAKGESKQKIVWSEEAEQAFEKIKHALTQAPILVSPDYSLPYKIYTDASLVAGAAVLTQEQGGIEKVIAYHSAKFTRTQQNYSATERECLAVLTGVEKFRPFIDGVEFTVVTDHASLKWLQNLKEPHGKLARWAVRLQAFNIKFEHRPGRQMVVPDALSRSVDLIEIEKETKTTDIWYNQMYSLAKSGKAQRYKIENERLYHLGSMDSRTGSRRWALCVPKENTEEAMREQHDQAHFGYWKSLRLAQRLYYWPNMHKSMYEYVQRCTDCKLVKQSNENTRVPTGKYVNPQKVGRILSIDLIGPLPASKVHKHIWIIMVMDAFSKYTFAKACTRANANTISEFLEKEVFYRFETPEIIVSDNGTQFTSDLFKKFVTAHKIKHVFVPNYHPQANQVEATNKCVKTLLRTELLRRADHSDWSSYLAKAIMNLNTTPRMPTGQSPHFIVFGKEKTQSGDEHRVIHDPNEKTVSEEEAIENRDMIYDQVAEQQRAMFEKNRRHYDLRARERTFQTGDTVYIKNNIQSSAADAISKKLAPVKKLAYIKEKVGNSSHMYRLIDGQRKDLGVYHASQIFTQ